MPDSLIFNAKHKALQRRRSRKSLSDYRVLIDQSEAMIQAAIDDVWSGKLTPTLRDDSWYSDRVNDAADVRYDIVTSNLTLHWEDNIPALLHQMKQQLKPGGLCIATILGGETLQELKHSIYHVEMELSGGVAPRTSPMIATKDAGMLMQHVGFKEPIASNEHFTLLYGGVIELMHELRGMAEQNALHASTPPLTRGLLTKIDDYYRRNYATEFNGEMMIPATFEMITLVGWNDDA